VPPGNLRVVLFIVIALLVTLLSASLNPFFMLPLMGILNVRARDLAGYSILQLLFHTPLVLIYCWLMAYTF
jgi:short-chain fatty acids transporter